MFITSPFRMFPDFWTYDLVFWRMVVQLRRMAFLNKIYSPRRVSFCPPISKSSLGTPPFIFHFLSLHILNYKCTNFYQNLSAGSISIGWNDLNYSQFGAKYAAGIHLTVCLILILFINIFTKPDKKYVVTFLFLNTDSDETPTTPQSVSYVTSKY